MKYFHSFDENQTDPTLIKVCTSVRFEGWITKSINTKVLKLHNLSLDVLNVHSNNVLEIQNFEFSRFNSFCGSHSKHLTTICAGTLYRIRPDAANEITQFMATGSLTALYYWQYADLLHQDANQEGSATFQKLH